MIVNRVVFRVKPGKMEKAVQFAKEIRVKLFDPGHSRLYTDNFAPHSSLSIEIEFKNFAAIDKLQAAWRGHPDVEEWEKTWNEVFESGGTTEIWDLV